MMKNKDPSRRPLTHSERGKLGGRPKGQKPLRSVALPLDLVDRIDAIAGVRHRSRWIAGACEEKLEKEEK